MGTRGLLGAACFAFAAPLGEAGPQFFVDRLRAGHVLGRGHLDGLVEHEGSLLSGLPDSLGVSPKVKLHVIIPWSFASQNS